MKVICHDLMTIIPSPRLKKQDKFGGMEIILYLCTINMLTLLTREQLIILKKES